MKDRLLNLLVDIDNIGINFESDTIFSQTIIDNCLFILDNLKYTNNIYIYPTNNNSIQFEFENDEIYIELEIYEDHTEFFIVDTLEENEYQNLDLKTSIEIFNKYIEIYINKSKNN